MDSNAILDLFDADGDLQQSRVGRLILAYLDHDSLQATALFEEIQRDERGEYIAVRALVIALVDALVELWEQHATREQIGVAVRLALVVRAAERSRTT
jgi:hypothetical protein